MVGSLVATTGSPINPLSMGTISLTAFFWKTLNSEKFWMPPIG